ncbi:MAG TPA: hypothetical protein DCS93_32040 [Microscillaceae bacterium]|nr:hypothetical protein [Microscillaceae bacterium]
MKSKALEYFLQLIIVVVGVFLGMLVTNWSNDRQQNKNQRLVLQSILKEMKVNQAKVEKAKKYHQKIFRAFDKVRANENYNDDKYKFSGNNLRKFLPGWTGVGMPNLDNAMYEMAKYSNTMPGMSYKIQESLSRVYHYQSLYNQLADKVIARFFEFNEKTPLREGIGVIWMMREGGYAGELGAIKKYKKAISLVEEELR